MRLTSPEVLKRLGLSVQRNLALIETVEDLIDQGHKRIILFAASVEGARLLSLIFKHLGHQAYSVDAERPRPFVLRPSAVSVPKMKTRLCCAITAS